MNRLAVAILVLCAATPAAAQLSPGPLAAAHAKLDDDQSCGRCHSSGRKVDDAKCLACHDALAARLRAGRGLHATYKDKSCASCHVEHLGAKARLVRWPGGAPEKLDHAQTGWPLRGAHATTPCAKCHKTPSYLGLDQACSACHADPHKNRFGPACASCHDETRFPNVKLDRFDHSRTSFPLAGKHAAVACKGCHGDPPRWTGVAAATCASCHKDPHQGRLGGEPCESCHTVQGWSQVAGFERKHPGLSLAGGHAGVACAKCHDRGNDRPPSKGSECVGCHKPVHTAAFGTGCKTCHASIRWLGLPREVGLDAHGKTRFQLRGAHVDVACASCHDPKLPAARRFRGLAADKCTACHKDPHPGGLAARFGGDCAACHGDASFKQTRFGVALHAQTGFPLDGKHQAAPCSTCHTSRVDLRVPKRACADCHANPHGADFATEIAQDGCARCHTAAGWRLAKVEHSTWPLTGAHASTECARCHASGYKGTPRACDACHADAHAGQFRLNAPVRGCEDCHDTTRYAGFPAARHEALGGWPLDGKHAEVACAGCHKPEPLRNGTTAVRWRLGYRACRACHADPHGTIPDGLDCGACHTAAGWKLAAGRGAGFDHARTGFPLVGAHRTAACAGCHDGRKPVPETCAGCHRDAHAGRLGAFCAECHTSVDWKDTQTLERHRRTRLPLTGRHAVLDCAACHVARGEKTWTNVPSDCYACHEKDYRRPGLHPSHVGPPAFPRACGQCHRPSGWSPATIDPSMLPRAVASKAAPHEIGAKHRAVPCAGCHVAAAAPRVVSCTGCHAHDASTLGKLHRGQPVATAAASCLACHPGEVAR